MAILEIIMLLVVVLGFAYFRTPVLLWTITAGVILLLLTAFSKLGGIFLSYCWIIYAIAATFANAKTLRQQHLVTPLFGLLKKRLPTISKTEQEAIEAGDVWWEKDLFGGRPQWKKLLAYPQPKLTDQEQNFIDHQVETVCDMLNDWEVMQTKDMPKAVWEYLKKEHFFGMIIPKEYGGLGFSALAHSTVVVKIATRCMSAAVNTMVPNSLGPAELLLHYGTAEQKKYYLPRLANGDEVPCFALTAPEAGSDAGSLTDSGVVCYGEYNGQIVLGMRLTWDKRYITLAPVATVLGIAFRLYDPEHLLGQEENIGITLCLVPVSHPGVEMGHRHLPLYTAFMNGPTRGTNVFVPLDWIIGGPAMAGQGWRMLMECLSVGRGISLPALSTASGKLAYRGVGGYARIRKQFNTAIANFEGVEEALGEIAGLTYILEASRIMTAGAIDLKLKPAIVTAIAKCQMTDIARTVVAHGMDILAGRGIQAGPRNFFATAHISNPIGITVEGANILTRNLIIFGQGAIRCHPYILQEVRLLAAENTPETIAQLDKTLLAHIGYILSNLARNVWYGLTGGKFSFAPVSGPTARYYRQLTRMSAALALLSDVTMLLLGGSLKRRERLSARLGDILSQLYLASAVLKYFQDNGQPKADVDYVKWSVEKCLWEIQKTCDEFTHNFPQRWLGKLLYWLIFPFGAAYRRPKDSLCHCMTKSMLEPSALRDRLTKFIYLSDAPTNPLRQIELALTQVVTIEPIFKKYQNALRSGTLSALETVAERLQTAIKTGILTQEEAAALRDFEKLYQEIIKVNEFSHDLSKVLI